jgi:glycosyltransferase involved in cell wall biosynthesis
MPPLKLCFIGWGNHVHMERWAGYFASKGHNISVLSFNGIGHYPPTVRQHVLHFAGRRPALSNAEIRFLLWRFRPDLVHVHWAHFAVAAARAWSGPLAVTAWGSDIYRREQFADEQWLALSRALSRANLLTCGSEDLARVMTQRCGLAEGSVQVVQWGVDVERFTSGKSKLAAELGIADRPVVLSVRNFTPIYNQETIVEAFAIARKSVPTAFLLMKNYEGDPAYLRSIRERIRALGLEQDCRIIDSVPYEMMADVYRAASVTVSIPLSDATSISLLEAMACGSLPLMSDLPSIREWIVDGENGYLVSPTDAEAVAHRMIQGLTDEAFRTRSALKNRQMVIERASQAVHMQRCEELYRDAIRRASFDR